MDFSNLRVMVLGEVGIDEYLEGLSSRRSPEADVPVISEIQQYSVAGMAGNLANQLTALGATADLHSISGTDTESSWLSALIVGHSFEIFDPECNTIRKQRIISNEHPVARLDFESPKNYSAWALAAYLDLIKERMPQYSAVFLQDYGKGLWNGESLQAVITLANSLNIPIYVDPFKDRPAASYNGCTVLKMNRLEAAIAKMSRMYLKVRIPMIIITKGDEGARLIRRGQYSISIPSEKIPKSSVISVAGAGDTFLAVLGLLLLQGDYPEDAISVAHRAAGIVIQKSRTAIVTITELNSSLQERPIE